MLVGMLTWLGWRQRADQALLQSFLSLEQARVSRAAQIDEKKAELEMRKLELEVEHAEQLASARNKQREFDENLRQKRREWTAQARERRKQKLELAKQSDHGFCKVCMGDNSMTAADIEWHYNGHKAGPPMFN